MKKVKLKICGMKYPENVQDITTLEPDYLGFIFWDKSKRYFDLTELPKLNSNIKKVGVFVNPTLEEIQEKVTNFQLDIIQLHGQESPDFCKTVQELKVEVIKAFSISVNFNFDQLIEYENTIDYFLFDTKGKKPGGNGISFDWELLENYSLTKPFFLSGGIGITSIDAIKTFLRKTVAQYCYGVDVNSRFEKKPGYKNYSKLKRFKKSLYEN
ncbi:phosphoribosylanthranilate isomerase [Flavobacterium jejuense]|uniref:N-(5'-phosphoribosyl)anthranilate isomerase n=1 Tax=Flavobacterium jejuense TaxID=1544455 RepID=A0ABX0IKI3_9FLAO|nr:phosphoribosylanthranilate isomerase [Flavobacterium jejuense]NHN24337.1 phosphoribosylanthranilate isomerase [Flavobacterium jejuense]